MTFVLKSSEEYEWHSWLFEQAPKHFWAEKEHQKKFFDWFASELGIHHLDDWKSITASQILERSGAGLLQQYGYNLQKAIQVTIQ